MPPPSPAPRLPIGISDFQRYPVIWMTFKDVKARAFDEAFASIQAEIRRAHEQHTYLLDAGAIRPEQGARFEQILRGEGPESLYADSLRELSALLAPHHGERVFILIDEYDSPIHAAGAPGDELRMLDFFRAFLSGGLKDNTHLQKGVLTGILGIAEDSPFSSTVDPVVYSLLRSECATCFGFTEAEVRDLAERTGATEHLPELERWYGGYRCGGESLYEPFLTVHLLGSADKRRRSRRTDASFDERLQKAILACSLAQGGEVEALIRGGKIRKRIDDRLALRDLDAGAESLWSFLLFMGYLKAEDVRQDDMDIMATLSIQNREVLSVYRTNFRTWLKQRLGGSMDVKSVLDGKQVRVGVA